MIADGKFNVVNCPKKEWQFYKRKNVFELEFDKLWTELERMRLAKHKSFEDVLKLSEYKYSPYMPLTEKQTNTLTYIINTIDSGELKQQKNHKNRPILINADTDTVRTIVQFVNITENLIIV